MTRPDLQVTEVSCESVAAFEALYSTLSFHISNPFLHADWMVPWFETVGFGRAPIVLQFSDADDVVGLAVLTQEHSRRRFFFKRRILYLNEYPKGDDNYVIEYNGIITTEEYRGAAWFSLLKWLSDEERSWDEFQLNIISENDKNAAVKASQILGLHAFPSEGHPAPYAELNLPSAARSLTWVEAEKNNISGNRRRQIRKSNSLLESQNGSIVVDVASDVRTALAYFDEMEQWHTQYWQGRGSGGAFANRKWVTFQKAYIEKHGPKKAQLIRISSGEVFVGIIYNWVVDGNVYNFQSGLNYQADNRIKPGFTCHHAAMNYNFDMGACEYHFLAGGEPYKQSLSAKTLYLYWTTIRKQRFFYIEDSLVKVVGICRKLVKKVLQR